MRFVFTLAVLTALALLWSLWGRNWLKAMDWGWSNAFFAWIEPIEIRLWKNSKTIFVARLKMLIGLLLTLATQLGAIDITPIMPFVPDTWEPAVRIIWSFLPLTISLVGWMDEQLRKETTKPLEVVALPEDKPLQVAEVVAKVEAVNQTAVAVVQEAKAEGMV